MSTSDTPRTDAEDSYLAPHFVPSEFARALERELNAAKSEVNGWRDALLDQQQLMSQWLNRRASVEDVLYSVAAGKRGPLTPEECRDLARKLGVPEK